MIMKSETQTQSAKLDAMTPRQIVEELDRYVIGQSDAKRMVAIAVRNRWRRQQLPPELREEIFPKNIIGLLKILTLIFWIIYIPRWIT